MYVKLFASILDSSIWDEDHATLRTFLSLLLMSNRDGVVQAAFSGLVRRSRCTRDEVRRALEILEAPDPESKDQDYGGRRIERIDGGWLVLNRAKYRDLKDADMEREQTAERVRQCRARKRAVTVSNAPSPQVEVEAEVMTIPMGSAEPEAPPAVDNPSRSGWKADAAVALREAGVPAKEIGDAIQTFWTAARKRFSDAEVEALVRDQGRRMKGAAWNPARVWNPNNADFDERFRYAMSQVRGRAARDRSASKGLAQVRDVLARAAEGR